MRRVVLLIGFALVATTPASGPASAADDVQFIDTNQLRCSDWKKVAPHVWTQTGVIEEGGHHYEGNTMDNTDQSRMLDLLCTG